MDIMTAFKTMDYGPAPESAAEAQAWLERHDYTFGHFINGAFTTPNDLFETRNPATGEVLAQVSTAGEDEVNAAVTAARQDQPDWESLGGPKRARFLYAAISTFRWSPAISTTMRAGRSCLKPNFPTIRLWAWPGRSFRGIFRCSCWPGKLRPPWRLAIPLC